ncbi:hypothetical protein HYN48_13725 [Flavobacterium magnum]|uniref:Uncharacterized protein n=1 Tax=Flavobacterium magnum TaxID=2162713 RepID=A0A2S0RIL0_9FLAO|nr:hypothetical protein [Flavobacterium magnum]AWA31058.1 hypothetical protein HYN48_13725 [Flavobacterium magnum]
MSRKFDYLMEVIGWLQIVASPFLISCIIGALIYFPNSTQTNLIIAIIIISLGLVVGILWANKIWKTKGTMWFVSQISATPEADNLKSVKDDNNAKKQNNGSR